MKPTPSQQVLIRQQLRSLLKYRDTYDEVYDHILSSLETLPQDIDIDDALNNIVESELGGTKGLKKIEAKYRGLAIKQFIKDYFTIAAGCLTSFVTPIIVLGTIGFYMLIRNVAYNDTRFTAIEVAIWLIPSFIQGTMIIKKRVFGIDNVKVTPDYMGDARTWIENINVGWLGMAIILLDTIVKFVYSVCFSSIKINLGAYTLTLLFFIAIVHSITYYKLYQDMQMRTLIK